VRAILALRWHGARRPRWACPLRSPLAHRRSLRYRGAFRDAAELRGVFSAINPGSHGELITYCTIGGRASAAWFVLTYLLGHDHVRAYDRSWAEWGRMTGTPVEQ
jgi:3-mercaptopyruvate sulfurtransferase SseA